MKLYAYIHKYNIFMCVYICWNSKENIKITKKIEILEVKIKIIEIR